MTVKCFQVFDCQVLHLKGIYLLFLLYYVQFFLDTSLIYLQKPVFSYFLILENKPSVCRPYICTGARVIAVNTQFAAFVLTPSNWSVFDYS